MLLGKGHRRGFCFRNNVVVVEPLPKRGVSSNFSVPNAQVSVRRVIPQAVLARATLD
jgi:hypothetical protein